MSAILPVSRVVRFPKVLIIRYSRTLAWVVLAVVTGLILRNDDRHLNAPRGCRVQKDVLYRSGDGIGQYLDIYQPELPGPGEGRPALLAFHGGGWRGGTKVDYGRSLVPLVREGFVVIAVDYRLSRPGYPSWPGNLEDVRAAVRWVRAHSRALGIDPRRIAAVGSSAGAHLALLLGSFSAENPSGVSAVIDFYGPSDLRPLGLETAPTFEPVRVLLGASLQAAPRLYIEASPLLRVSRETPPTLALHGSDDALIPLEQSIMLVEALKNFGVPNRLIVVEGARHGFGLQAGRTDLVPEIVSFLKSIWNSP